MIVRPDGSIEVSTLAEAVELSKLLDAHQGDQRAPGSTGGERAPTTRPTGTTRRRPPSVGAEQALEARPPARDAQPVAEEVGGPPPAPRATNGGGRVCSRCEETRPASDFSAGQGRCKACHNAVARERYEAAHPGSKRYSKRDKAAPVDAPSTTLPPARPADPFDRAALIRQRAEARAAEDE